MTEVEDDVPFDLFAAWFAEAEAAEPREPNAAALATATGDAAPSVRMVLLKGWDKHGFVFYTNLNSRKSLELKENNQAALLFHWKSLNRQIRIEGTVELVSDDEADSYFASRPRESQLGAWASKQSQPLPAREIFQLSVTEYRAKFDDRPVPRPEFWSGWRLAPETFEFWQEGDYRMHHRDQFRRLPSGSGWARQLLYP